MLSPNRTCVAVLMFVVLAALAGCQDAGTDNGEFAWKPLYGDGGADNSAVIATVAGLEITENDLNLRFDELPPQTKKRYEGEEGRRLLLKKMVETVWMARGAVDRELYNRTEVSRTLISQRRVALERSMQAFGLFEENAPAVEQLQAFFMANRDRYQIQGRVLARHIECASRADAQTAYDRIVSGGRTNTFPYLVKEYSVNRLTAEEEGSLGWFNEGGFIPNVRNSDQLSKALYNLPEGLNEPVYASGAWHVVEIQRREPPRPQTFNEARTTAEQDFLPTFQEQLINEYLAGARETYPVEYAGRYAPGGGVSDEALFQRARLLADPEAQLEVLSLVIDEFPDSDRRDDALFLAAQAVLDRWADTRQASIYLQRLVDEHPDSELVDDAQYLLENMHNPKAWAPESIEDLRR